VGGVWGAISAADVCLLALLAAYDFHMSAISLFSDQWSPNLVGVI
jgi:hypothetical protein